MMTIPQTMKALDNALGYNAELDDDAIYSAMQWSIKLRGQEIGQAIADRLNLWIARVERAESE